MQPRDGGGHPVSVAVSDDLGRSRLTVLFRAFLGYPHYLWLAGWSVAALVAALAQWPFTLAAGRPAEPLHRFLVRFLRYATQVRAYLSLAADPFPGFLGEPGRYPVDLVVESPRPQPRWKTLLRPALAIPALVFASVLGQVLGLTAFLGWFAALALGRLPKGMRDLAVYCIRFEQQTLAYVFSVTDRYPGIASAERYGPAAPRGSARAPVLSSVARRLGGHLLELLFVVATLIVGWLVWSFIVWGRGQTPAKQVLGMRVAVLETGAKASWSRMALREIVGKGLLGLGVGLVPFGFILYFWLLWDGQRQELWDKIAGTIVVDDPMDQLV